MRKRCPQCGRKMHNKGKTSAGKQRWYCHTCRLSSTRKKPGSQQHKYYKAFKRWLVDKRKLEDLAKELRVTRRTLQGFLPNLRYNIFARLTCGARRSGCVLNRRPVTGE